MFDLTGKNALVTGAGSGIGQAIAATFARAAALYLASDEAAMVTVSCLKIDGGWSAGK
jgi:NAD(P)-dependent dehydrogenase (short-subunit alcohol dehydrogenase family)